ncbi:RHS repeat-associated core domain-containing protein [Polymorphospora rubra]|uniref:RHS repeat-associated core domain-containing protein n=1 Tax=Polymorphospora rubra TaxID=338584 RepID=UPI003402C9DA
MARVRSILRTNVTRRVSWTAAALAAVMAGTLLSPVRVEAKPTLELPELQTEKSVPGKSARINPTPPPAPAPPPEPEPVGWPAASVNIVTSGAPAAGRSTQGRAETSPVTVARTGVAGQAGPTRVAVDVRDQPTANRVGVSGVLLGVRSDDGQAGKVAVEVDYGSFRHAYGGDWASRLRLVRLPSCALTNPDQAGCRQPTVLPTRNDTDTTTLTAEVDLAGATLPASSAGERAARHAPETLLAVTAAAAGSSGSYAATTLSPTGTWSAGGSSGDFSWSYPLDLPPSLGGPAPQIGFGYSSGSIDGRTVATNNQASWIGDGWDFWPGYIERRYKSCAEDMGTGANNTVKTGDLCWASHNVTLSLNGSTTELVRDDATGAWRPQQDDGSRVELLTGASNGDNDGEHWRVTTTDGTQYYFGRNRLPNWTSNKPETKSAWTVPVFGNHSGDPCRATAFANSWCQQAWRWNIDHVVDPRGNSMAFFYGTETNHYGLNLNTNGVSYVRAGYLDRIEYGHRDGQEYTKQAPARVNFTTAERCLPTQTFTCTPAQFTKPNAGHWPDVPFDQNCEAGVACTDRFSPTFWTRKRLTAVTTQVLMGSAYSDVNTWNLSHEFPPTGDDTEPALWLSGISRTGKVGGTVTTPEVRFIGHLMANRVDGFEGIPPITRRRINTIHTETGSTVGVEYSATQCSRSNPTVLPSAQDTNAMRCFPVYWTPEGATDPTLDWFHKYLAVKVVEQDRSTEEPAPPKETSYEYVGNAAWAYDDSEFTKTAHRTWSQWRGYARVKTRVGTAPTPPSLTETLFFRGMHGDRLSGGGTRNVQVTDSEGGQVNDLAQFQGMVRETLYYSGDGGNVQSATVNTPSRSAATATRVRSGTTNLAAYVTVTNSVKSRTLLSDTTWRRSEVRHSFDGYGIPTQTSDLGDLADPNDDSCTRHEYARNTTAWILNTASRVEKVAVNCSATPSRPADVVSDTRMYHDGTTTLGTAPTYGNVTRVEELMEWPASGPRYAVTGRSVFDAYGRVTEQYDVDGNKTETGYLPAADALVSQIVTTNPKLHESTTHLDPRWGITVAEVDANGRRTDLAYDPLGRLTGVWLPGRDKATHPNAPNSRFSYQLTAEAPVVVTTETLKEDSSYRVGYEIYDGLLRLRQTQQPGANGGRILTDTFYDNRGLVAKKNAAYHHEAAPSAELYDYIGDQAIPSQMTYQYDGMGRPVTEIFRSHGNEKWRTVTGYGGDRVHVDPPTGGTATTRITDAHGRTTELRQYHGATPSGTYDATTYRYDRFGRPSEVEDPAGNIWVYGYDLRGRQVRTDHPDRGETTTTYDDADRLVSTTDARGQTVSFNYDELSRPTKLRHGSPATGTVAAEWTYDTLALGLPTSSTRWVGTNAYTTEVTGYNTRYQPTGTKYTIPASEGALAGQYSFGASYSANTGLLKTNTYPSGAGLPSEVVTYGYNGLDMLDNVRGLARYLQATNYSPYGEPLRHTFGNLGKEIFLSYTYEAGTRRLKEFTVDRVVAPTRLDQITYDYDSIGNIKQIKAVEQSTTTDTQCFTYDHLRRMTDAWTGTDECAAAPSPSTVGGPNPYWHSYTFDAVGNRLTEVQHDTTGGGADVEAEYSYPTAGGAQPHALSSVTTSGPPSAGLPGGSRLDEFEYDAAGNTIERVIGGTTQELEWNPEGRLSKVTKGSQVTEYVYDAGGSRLIRRDPTTVTLYLGGTELTLNKTTSAVSGTRYYSGVGAVRTPGNKVDFLIADHHGTAQQSIDAVSLASTRRKFTPYGQPRGGQPSVWPGQKGFVGGTVDASTGLTSLGAREYDPAVGRFLSVDPVVDHGEPQQMHGYAYANNSPATYTDPSGLRFCVDDDCSTVHDPQTGITQGGGVYKRVPPAAGKPAPSGPSDEEVRKAKQTKEKTLLDVVIGAGGQILMEVLGINDIRDCVMNGDVGACVMSVVGALPWGKLFKAKKIGEALWRAGKAVLSWFDEIKWAQSVLRRADEAAAAAAKQAADDAAATAAKQGDNAAGRSCVDNSFTPGTHVLLADGTTKPIEDVELGDEVVAYDTETGEAVDSTVSAVIVGEGEKKLVDVAVDTDGDAGDQTATITATDGHPFWVPELGAWIDAAKLQPGQWLQTAAGTWVRIAAVHAYTEQQRVHNLTVTNTHTYHVMASDQPILVHNCKPYVWEPFREGVAQEPQDAVPSGSWMQPGDAPAEGWHHFVVMTDGSLRAMQDDVMFGFGNAGHTSLGERNPVIMAGRFNVGQGQIIEFDNWSGHYQPQNTPGFASLEGIARAAFGRHGLPTPGRNTWIHYFHK